MILGVGLGVVETRRFRAAETLHGDRLRGRLFTAGELSYASSKRRGHESLAVRFAAKLAAARALGLPGFAWRDVEVSRRRGRPPELAFQRRARRVARARGVAQTSLSLTHDERWCIAHVVLEGPS